jgi:predicted ester cyclase
MVTGGLTLTSGAGSRLLPKTEATSDLESMTPEAGERQNAGRIQSLARSQPMTELNESIVRRFFREVVGWGRLEPIDELFAGEDRLRTHSGRSELSLEWLKTANHAFRDRIVVVEDMYSDGDLVSCRWSARLTQTTDFRGVEPQGQTMEFGGTSVFRFQDARIVETWDYEDAIELGAQSEWVIGRPVLEAVAG